MFTTMNCALPLAPGLVCNNQLITAVVGGVQHAINQPLGPFHLGLVLLNYGASKALHSTQQ